MLIGIRYGQEMVGTLYILHSRPGRMFSQEMMRPFPLGHTMHDLPNGSLPDDQLFEGILYCLMG